MNALVDALSPTSLGGRNAATTTGLTWGYYGGRIYNGGARSLVANGTVSLTASATNYVQMTTAGVVSVNTTGFTTGQIPLYQVTTGTSTVTNYIDQRTYSPNVA